MKKKLFSLLAIFTALLLAAGCTSRGVSPEGLKEEAAAEEAEQELYDAGEIIPLDCDPLTGAKLPENAVQGARPVAVMLDNSVAALPQTGIGAASVVYEMVTEGGIPRLMAVYSDTGTLRTVGPVRSTRDQFVQLAVPENMLLCHIGSSIYATNMLQQLDTARAASGYGNEHCWYVGNDGAEAGAAQKGISITGTVTPVFDFISYEKPVRLLEDGSAGRIDYSFSQNVPVALEYNEEYGVYVKYEYGQMQTDLADGMPVYYTNVFVLDCNVTLKSDGLCTDFDFSGGEGWYFYGGGFQKICWEKGDISDSLLLTDAEGKPLQVNVGTSYIAFVDHRALQRSLLLDGVSPFAAGSADASVSQEG